MNAKPENIPYDKLVAEALERMKEATSAAPGYQVDRSSGRWIVRRSPTTAAVLVPEAAADENT